MNNLLPRIDPEFIELIPPLSKEEYSQLEQNILAYRKCRDAIVVWGDTIVDGHNRFRICAEHGIPFEIKEIDFESRDAAKLWILDNQLGRRNLTDAVRIEVALSKVELLRQQAKKNLRRGGRKKSSEGQIPENPDDTRAEKPFSPVARQDEEPINVHKAVASEAGVSDGTVHHFMQIAKHGSPELLEGVKSGDLKIKTAYRLLETEILKKLKHADKLCDYIEKNFPIEGDEEANQKIRARFADLRGHLEVLRRAKNA